MNQYEDAYLINELELQMTIAGSLRKWAKLHDFSPSYLSDVRSGRRGISERLAKELGFVPVRRWHRSG